MSAATTSTVFRVPGRLIKGPTNLSAAYPYGGTELGSTDRGVRVLPTFDTELIGMPKSRAVGDVLYLGSSWVVGANLRNWDNDMISTVFPNTSAGGSGNRRIEMLGAFAPGTLLGATRAVILLFVPEELAEGGTTSKRSVLIHQAIPLVEETAVLNLSVLRESVWACMFYATEDSNGNAGQIGLLADLSLT